MSTPQTSPTASTSRAPSAWSPFRHATFSVIWGATVISNIGGWMYSAASGWLMTSLNPDPFVVSMVQVASTLPMFLLAVPAGALGDIIDQRKFLIFAELAITVVGTIFAAFVAFGLATPVNLLLFTFLASVGSALTFPTWQAIVPQLVAKQDLSPAVTANSVGVNVSRAIGPALAGEIVGPLGIAAPFWIGAISNLGVIGALVWWHPPHKTAQHLPVERFGSAIRAGFRHARNNPRLHATLIRAAAFYLFASAYWALLPLVTRSQIDGGPGLYGDLLGTIGIAAVGGAFALPWLKARLGPDRLVAAGTIGTAVAMILFGLARDSAIAILASILAGATWIAVLSSLNVSGQMSLPDWVRGRGIAIFVTVFFGSLSLGSATWGEVAAIVGLPIAHFLAAAGALLAIPLTWRYKLLSGPDIDLTPSLHWPAPIATHEIEEDRGPVLVTVEYRIDPPHRAEFLAALENLGRERRRDGAYAWGVFEDAAEEGRMLETFLVESWLEHLRQHERVTNADRVVQDAVNRFHTAGIPKVTHLIAADCG